MYVGLTFWQFSYAMPPLICSRCAQLDATPLHLLCMNDHLTVDCLRAVLLVVTEEAFTQDSVCGFEAFSII